MRYRHQPGLIGVTLGTIDEESILNDEVRKALEPKSHIFTSQKVWWCDTSNLPERERFGGTFEEDMKAWEGKEG